jgi:hypothetical protein
MYLHSKTELLQNFGLCQHFHLNISQEFSCIGSFAFAAKEKAGEGFFLDSEKWLWQNGRPRGERERERDRERGGLSLCYSLFSQSLSGGSSLDAVWLPTSLPVADSITAQYPPSHDPTSHSRNHFITAHQTLLKKSSNNVRPGPDTHKSVRAQINFM